MNKNHDLWPLISDHQNLLNWIGSSSCSSGTLCWNWRHSLKDFPWGHNTLDLWPHMLESNWMCVPNLKDFHHITVFTRQPGNILPRVMTKKLVEALQIKKIFSSAKFSLQYLNTMYWWKMKLLRTSIDQKIRVQRTKSKSKWSVSTRQKLNHLSSIIYSPFS